MALKVGNLLDRYSHLAPPDLSVRQIVCECVQKELGIKIPLQRISIDRRQIFIQASPVVRNEIMMRKIKILEEISRKLGKDAPIDLR